MRRFVPVPVFGAALAGLLLAGCGGSSKAVPPTSAECTQLNTVLTAVGTAGSAKELTAAKSAFTALISDVNSATTNAPSSAKKDLSAASKDINTLNTWVQTQATQSTFSAQQTTGVAATPAVGTAGKDLGTQVNRLRGYVAADCPSS